MMLSKRQGFAKRSFAVSTERKRVMPKIRRHNLPPALLNHLVDRIRSREISADQLGLLADWLDTEPEAPEGRWFKRFSEMIVCSEGELVKTFLTANQIPTGTELF